MAITSQQSATLVDAALSVRQQAYAPYSKFLVGAAVLTASGRIIAGCNVENASYGLSLCAERNAIAAMVAQGEREIAAVAVACAGAGTPCGACRQVMAEFGTDFDVMLVDADRRVATAVWQVSDLLPHAFRLNE